MSESIPQDPERETEAGQRLGHEVDELPYDTIAKRAYEIFESGSGGTPKENWEQAEAELREERART